MWGLEPDILMQLRSESGSGEQTNGIFWHNKARDTTTLTQRFVHQNVSRELVQDLSKTSHLSNRWLNVKEYTEKTDNVNHLPHLHFHLGLELPQQVPLIITHNVMIKSSICLSKYTFRGSQWSWIKCSSLTWSNTSSIDCIDSFGTQELEAMSNLVK